jgi:predicted HNH restriction endonuclease
MKKNIITVSDDITFRTIAEACNSIFGDNYKGMQDVHFISRNLGAQYGDKYLAWFFTVSPDGVFNKNGWSDQVSDDGLTIFETTKNRNEKAEEWRFTYEIREKRKWTPRITFAKFDKNGYRFIGIFETRQIQGWVVEHKRIADTFPVIAADSSKNLYPDEIDSDDGIPEGAKKSIIVNAYERDPKARKQCIEHFTGVLGGVKCSICGFDFGQVYGADFEGKIHVHHIEPLSKIRKTYKVSPINDLIPVCPNCHLVLHSKKDGVYTPEEVRGMIENNSSPSAE